MTQLDIFDALAEQQQSTIEAVADDADYARFLRVCEAVARMNDGLVTVNKMREFVEAAGIDFEPRHYSAFWNRATAKGGPMENVTDEDGLPVYEACKPTKTGRNGGKPQRVRKWVGVVAKERAA